MFKDEAEVMKRERMCQNLFLSRNTLYNSVDRQDV